MATFNTQSEVQETTRPFGMRDKIGYLFGDLANDMTFMFQSMFLMLFYTDVLGIPGGAVGTLFVVARLVDAVTDMTMGRLVDRAKATKEGKFKPWIRRIAGPVALASFLMYQTGMQDASMTMRIVYMYATYILWGSITYTAVNIPYGSMASAITSDPDQRTELSTFRSLGATTAGLIIGSVVPLFIFETSAAGQDVVKTDSTFTILAGVFSILAVLFYFICHRLTTERVKVEVDESVEKMSLGESLKTLVKNRSMVGIVLAALFLIMAQLMMAAMNNYVYPNVYGNAAGISLFNILTPLVALFVVIPLAPKLSRKFGKKEVGTASMFVAALAYAILFIWKTENMYVFVAFSVIAMAGFNLFNAVIWANITDVIDDIEIETNERQDGTVYSVYSFARKIGQSLAGGAGGWALGWIGYQSGASIQTPEVVEGIYNVSTVVPGLAFLLAGLALMFVYPLSKNKVKENAAILERRRMEKE